MARYESGDVVTYWFVICTDRHGSRVQAFSDNKDLVKAYMEFHKSPDFEIKPMTDKIDTLAEIINENTHDEIQIANLRIRDPKAKDGKNPMRLIQAPVTETELILLNDDTNNFLNSAIPYGYLNAAIPYLKDKWQEVLDDIFLPDVIRKVVHQQTTSRMADINLDQLMLMLKIPNAHFGL